MVSGLDFQHLLADLEERGIVSEGQGRVAVLKVVWCGCSGFGFGFSGFGFRWSFRGGVTVYGHVLGGLGRGCGVHGVKSETPPCSKFDDFVFQHLLSDLGHDFGIRMWG